MKIVQLILVLFTVVAAQTPTRHIAVPAKELPHDLYGILQKVEGSRLTIETRSGKLVQVDATVAFEQGRTTLLRVGHAVDARGKYDGRGVLHADTILRWKDSPSLWPLDN
jgi:hypothetical protein